MSLHTEFDKGSLIWVKSEIEETFSRAEEALQGFAAGGEDTLLKHAQTYLHQACGALVLVDLPGVARFCEEIEQTLAALAQGIVAKDEIPVLIRGIETARGFLERLMAGMANQPLLLLPVYRDIAALTGHAASGAELFFPQLQLDLPAGLPQKTLPEGEFDTFTRRQRSRFEHGLLRWLQNQPHASQIMAASLSDVAAHQKINMVRVFWWTAAALALGLATNRAPLELDTRQLLLRINLQLRRLADGSGKVAERLFRDMLYVLAQLDCDSAFVKRLQQTFDLAALFPSADAMATGIKQDGLHLARNLRDELRPIKDSLSRIASGQTDRLAQFDSQLSTLADRTAELDCPALQSLLSGMTRILRQQGNNAPGDELAIEFATALLLVDNALTLYPDIPANYASQVETLLQRLQNPGSSAVPQLDEISREAQERLLTAQLAQEIRANLHTIEEQLDSFFRNPNNREILANLSAPLYQVQGALMMMERPLAVELLQECQKYAEAFLNGEPPEQEELENLAEALSTLGFYIDDLEQGREKDETLQPVLAKLCGTHEPAQAEPAVAEILESEPELPESGQKAETFMPPAEPASEARPLPVSEAAMDAELLEVYLEEAVEVLATIAERLEACRSDAFDRESLTVIRRSFHTLKGSGRMVGLFNLGDVAWAIEQVMNKLLQLEKPAPVTLLDLIAEAHTAFSGWVDELRERGEVEVEASFLLDQAKILREALEAETEFEAAGMPAQAEPTLATENAPASDELVIGNVTVSATLFAIFQEESERHLQALKRGVAMLTEQGIVETGFVLAAHTLGGIASTTGFRPQGELAYALEHALQQLGAEAAQHLPLIDQAVTTLGSMLASILACEVPAQAPELIQQLEALRIEAPVLELEEEPEAATTEAFPLAEVSEGAPFALETEAGLERLPAAEILPQAEAPTEEEAAPAEEAVTPAEEETAPAEEVLALAPETCHEVLDELAHELHPLSSEVLPESGANEEIPLPELLAAESLPLETLIPAITGIEALEQVCAQPPTPAAAEAPNLEARRAEIEASFSDDLDEQLLPIFIEEADELLPTISAQLHALTQDGGDEALSKLRRALHTMKGSARMSGAMRIGEVAHRMESLIEGISQVNDVQLGQLDSDYELLQQLLEEISGRAPVETPPSGEAVAITPAMPAQLQRSLLLGETENRTTIRVKAELVDELVNQAGEVAIARSRIEAEMLALKGSLTDLTENVARLRNQLREIEIQAESQMQARVRELQAQDSDFDPLEFDRFSRLQELTRFMAESVNDVSNVQMSLLKNFDESNAALTAQARMTRDLQQSLMRVRLVPFNSLSERLYRLARTTGKEVGKKVNLEIRGGSVEIDRGVLEKMVSPLEHMLRNAIDHGLEQTAERLEHGKPEFGEIQIEARQEGNELVLLLKDDGRGLDLDAIRAKGIEKGLISAEQALPEHDIAMLIFEPGFSTASNVTQLSGRGIGMDVVRNEISNLGGRIDLTTTHGTGTTFVVRLPLTLAVTQVLLVRCGERLIAIPSVLVEQVQELKREALATLYLQKNQEWLGQRYPFAYLPRLLGDLYRQPEQKRHSTVLLLRSGTDRLALHIDNLVKNQEVVVKPIGPQLARIPGVIGGTVLGTGEIVLIMNPLFLQPLAEQIATIMEPAARTLASADSAQQETLQTTPVVMVVDDSLTVRKITGRLLTREGYQVVTAKDGVDALQQLQDIKPAVMLVDIEMPRMDGFELTRNIRATPETRNIPIVMITSRTADKHRKVAFDLGVNVFLGKPYQEDELLEHVRRLINQ